MTDKLIQLFLAFLKIGAFSIGGGYAVIPLIREQVVLKYGWITQRVFTDVVTLSQMTPGPLAVNTSTFVGIQIAGIPGAVIATFGCVISGILMSLSLYAFFRRYKKSAYVFEVLNSLKATSLGLIISAAATIALLSFFNAASLDSIETTDWIAIAIFSISIVLLKLCKISPILLICISGFLGYLAY